MGSYTFEAINNFSYLRSKVNIFTDLGPELSKRIIVANCEIDGLQKYVKSMFIKQKLTFYYIKS